jgi:hypothetical protein
VSSSARRRINLLHAHFVVAGEQLKKTGVVRSLKLQRCGHDVHLKGGKTCAALDRDYLLIFQQNVGQDPIKRHACTLPNQHPLHHHNNLMELGVANSLPRVNIFSKDFRNREFESVTGSYLETIAAQYVANQNHEMDIHLAPTD